MNVNRIMLLGQSSERDLAQDLQEGAESNINFNFGLNPSDDKPWPYELTLHSEITLKKGDSEKNVSPLFVSDLRYAIQFDSPIDDENTPAALSVAWPYMREKLVEQLQSHDIPAMSIVPLSIAALPAKSQ